MSEYHHTLYYYDLAGNLVKTIPPEGVRPNRDPEFLADVKTHRTAGTRLVNDHGLRTIYQYNSLNQVKAQQSPDGGYSRFWYDRLGRLAVSQNAKQQLTSKYSYTKYDFLGRITEVGEKAQLTAMTQTTSRNAGNLLRWMELGNLNTIHAPRQVTITTYDEISNAASLYEEFTSFIQKSYTLRNRVSYTRLYETPTYTYTVNSGDTTYAINSLTFSNGSEYSYDIHGNVDSLLNIYGDNSPLEDHGANQFKLMAYQYDLISGKVNQVHYSPGEADELYHRYEYDAENRLTDVFITDQKAFIGQSQLEEHNAYYKYYKHGPLARMVLGQLQVQGIDYAYTLQGWLKGVNSISLGSDHDMGSDGGTAMPKDVYGYQLNYYTGDYSPIKSGVTPFPGHTAFIGTEYRPLYNGNISSMAVNIGKFEQPQLYNYKYDQLNRIKRMDSYRGFNEVANNWNGLTHTLDYRERVNYDGNGNILRYDRYGTIVGGTEQKMDSLQYGYNVTDGMLQNNTLRHVKDKIDSGNYTVDIDEQGDDNYEYEAIGNLIRDEKDSITLIEWTVYGKIDRIEKLNGTEIKYGYDVSGNRITKSVTKDEQTKHTSYVRDASGNVMAVYEQAAGSAVMRLKEQHLYGSSRLGLWQRDRNIDVAKNEEMNLNLLGLSYRVNFERGQQLFELSNHLGNVLVTVSDKKFAEELCTDGIPPVCYVVAYAADVVTASDYYPGGMEMLGRKYGMMGRYGFNGKEQDQETTLTTTYDYGFRIYSPALGRFLSVDPLFQSFPWYTPYQFAGNKPIACIDLDGLEEKWKITTELHLDYYPVLDAPDVGTGIVNAAGSGLNFVWNNTLGAVLGAGKSAWNWGVDQFSGNPEPPPNPIYGINLWLEGQRDYFKHTPKSKIWKDFKESATDLNNYELGTQSALGLGLSRWSMKGNVPEWGRSTTLPMVEGDVLLATKARVFESGGSIGILEGTGELTINASTKRLTGQMTLNDKTVFFEGQVSVTDGVLSIKDVGIRNKLGTYNNTDLVGEIGFAPFKNLIDELKKLREKGGYKEGELEFERMRPDGSNLPDSEKRVISF